jgi:hypothetical protein
MVLIWAWCGQFLRAYLPDVWCSIRRDMHLIEPRLPACVCFAGRPSWVQVRAPSMTTGLRRCLPSGRWLVGQAPWVVSWMLLLPGRLTWSSWSSQTQVTRWVGWPEGEGAGRCRNLTCNDGVSDDSSSGTKHRGI